MSANYEGKLAHFSGSTEARILELNK